MAAKTADIYNGESAGSIERVEELLPETGDGQRPFPLTIDLAEIIENFRVAAKEQVAYLVDMAKADALDLLGENRQALELADCHFGAIYCD